MTPPHPPRKRSLPPDHDIRRFALQESIRNGLWFIPATMVLGTAILGRGLAALDEHGTDLPGAFRGDASSAQTLLATIAASTLTMTTLVVSITIVALQLASQQFSPRVMRTFFRDTGTKVALGVFLSTTVYALLVLRVVVPEDGTAGEYVPGCSVSAAFVFMLGSLAAFVYYLNHVAHSIRAVHIMEAVAAETRDAIRHRHSPDDQLAPGEWPARPPDLVVRSELPPGAVIGIDEDDLVALAASQRIAIEIIPHIGDYAPSMTPLARIWSDDGAAPTTTAADITRHVGLGRERTMGQDVAFGFRQLVDMADRALSPAVNDPTTATQVIDRIHDLLRRIAIAPDPCPVYRDSEGAARLLVPVQDWDDIVHLALDEIRQYGGGSLHVQRMLRILLEDLTALVADRPDRLAPLLVQRSLLDRAAARAFFDPEDQLRAGMVPPEP
ncbi:DUF2254 domain-containing protein [Aquihabitans daechungensis]|uniref:DUF2254 domain-containing protein n=1 Tax=Aquihabitans daechungensis TaxID=1052257 RepID=UPI003BA21B58